MPLDKTTLKQRLTALANNMASRTADPAQARADYVDGLADAIEAFVKTGTVTGTVTTTGTATAQGGTITSSTIT